jgi:hypothetical protein
MGMALSRRCFRCKAFVGWQAQHCSYCQYRKGNENEDRAFATASPLETRHWRHELMDIARAIIEKIGTKRL